MPIRCSTTGTSARCHFSRFSLYLARNEGFSKISVETSSSRSGVWSDAVRIAVNPAFRASQVDTSAGWLATVDTMLPPYARLAVTANLSLSVRIRL